MAKKVKTPEEVRAAMEKKTAKRTLFFGTFRKAFALFLAIAFTFALVQIAFTKNVGGVAVATGGSTGGTVNNGGTVSGGSTGGSTDSSGQGENQTEAPAPDLAGDEPTVAEGETVKDKEGNDVVGLSKGDAVKLLNDATAAAAKAGYDWSRTCYYTDNGALQVKMGSADATNFLNGFISGVTDSSLDQIVGNFLDITGKDDPKAAKKAKGSAAAPEGMKDKFLLKGMSLTEGDVAYFSQTGNVYKFQLNSCENPQKPGDNALYRATNDYVTHDEVKKDVENAISAFKVDSTDVQYSNIVIVAEIKDGQLTSLTLNYLMTVKGLNLKVAFTTVVGTGQGQVEEVYKNFVY